MATNLNYNVNVNTSNGVQALNNLQNKVDGVNSAFAGLRNALAGIAVGQVLSNVIRFADAIKDISDVTGIATTEILGFQKAVELFGGSAEAAQKGMLRLVSNIGEAADGSASLQSAFARVGVTLEDLATLSERDILFKTVRGLEGITDKSTQAALKTQLLGKEFRNISTSGLSDAIAQSTEESRKYAEAIDRAAQLQENLDKAIGKVKLTLLEIISPMADFVNSMDQTKIASAIDGFTKLAAVMVAFSAFGKIVAILEGITIGLTGAAGAAAMFGLNIIKNFTLIGRILTGIGALVIGFKTLFPDAAKSITESFSKAVESAKEFFGIESPKFLDQAEVDRENKLLAQRSKALEDNGKVVRAVKDPFDQLRKSLQGIADEYARGNQLIIDQITASTALIGKSREESEVIKIRTELMKRESDEIRKLEEQRSKLTQDQVNAGLGKEIDRQIEQIRERTRADLESAEAAVRASQERTRAYDLERFARQSQIDVEKQIRDIQFEIATSTMSEMERKAAQIRRDAQERAIAEIKVQEAARGTLMTEAEKQKYYEAAAQKSDELIRANEQLYQKSRQFSTGWKNAFREYIDNATNAAKRAESIFRKATQGMEDLLVNFVKTGKFEWKNFVSMMLEELLRAQIQQIFAQLLGSMNNTVKSGGGLFDSIMGLFGGGGENQGPSGSSSGSLLGNIMGGGAVGSSPNNPLYVIDISSGTGGVMGPQQQGGGIWDTITGGISKVWEGIKSGAGTIWDGIKSVGGSIFDTVANVGSSVWEGVKSVGSGISDAISGIGGLISGGGFGGGLGGGGGSFLGDIASGIGDFFGGWFANGGTLGAGKWGIAGENGPEVISGPASITPMSGTNVVYNINAVDAMSFKQMLAQDPGFIYGLTMQGSKAMPARR